MRYAILSDIHANADAFTTVLKHIPDSLPIWFLGDAVGYYPDFSAVLDQLQDLQRSSRLQVWLKGNHDFAAHAPTIAGLDMSGVARVAIELTRAMLTPGERYLLALLEERPLVLSNLQITLTHAGPDDPLMHYMEHTSDAAIAAKDLQTALCLVGHTHVPLKLYLTGGQALLTRAWRKQELFKTADNTFRYTEAMVFLNPGSVGQPRDGFSQSEGGFPHAAYAILDTEARTFAIQRVPYDLDPLKERIRAWLRGHLTHEQIESYILRLDLGV